MKITRLRLSNFRNYRDQEIRFDRPRTLIMGPNGAGKSTIVDAILYAMTGRCRGVNAKGEGQLDLIQVGHNKARVVVDFEEAGDPGSAERIVHNQGGKAKTFGTTPRGPEGIFQALFYGSTFFRLHHAAAKDLLLGVLDVKIPIRLETGKVEFLTLHQADERYSFWFQKRTSLKRDLAGLKPAQVERTPDLEGIDTQVLKRAIQEAELSLEKTVEAKGYAAAQARATEDKNLALARITKRQAERKGIEDQLGRAKSALKTAKQGLDEATRKLARLKDPEPDIRQARLYLGPLVSAEGRDMTRCVLGDAIPCSTAAAEFTKAGQDLQAKIARLEKRQAEYQDRQESINELKVEVAGREVEIQQVTRLLQTMDDDNQRDQSILNQDDPSGVEYDAGLEVRQRKEIERLQGKLALVHQYQGAMRQNATIEERLAKVKADLEEAEGMVALLGPQGVRLIALNEALADFLGVINDHLNPFGFTIDILVDPWKVSVVREEGFQFPFEFLSKGQQLWTGLAFQLALAQASGFGFCVVDDVEGVVGDHMKALTKLIMSTSDIVPQVLIVKADDKEGPADNAALQVLHVQDGTIMEAVPEGA